jgi:hypothetical protein
MQLTEADIQKYQQLVKELTGKELDNETAAQFAQGLIRLVQMVYKPMTKEQFKKYHTPIQKQ